MRNHHTTRWGKNASRARDASYIPNKAPPPSNPLPPETETEPDGGGEPNTVYIDDDESLYADGFTQIPNILLRAPDLSAEAKLVYAVLLSYAWQKDRSFPGMLRLCTETAIKSQTTLRKYLRELCAIGLMTIKRRGQGKTNVYILHVRVLHAQVLVKQTTND